MALSPVEAHPDDVRALRKDNESAPNLYIEFEDEHTEPLRSAGAGKLVSNPEAIGVPPSAAPRTWWPYNLSAVLPARYRKVVAGVVALAGLGAAIGDSLAAQAAQQAADRSSVAVMNASYSPSIDGQGLILIVDIANSGPSALTLTKARADQSDLTLQYGGQPLSMAHAQQVEIVMWGTYDCSQPGSSGADNSSGTSKGIALSDDDSLNSAASTGTVHLTLRNVHGDQSTIDAALPPDALLPDHWDSGQAAYCAWVWSGGFDD